MSTLTPSLPSETTAALDAALARAAASGLPGCFYEVVSASGSLYSSRSGQLDILEPEGPENEVDEETVLCFFSCTKLLTSVSRSTPGGSKRRASSPSLLFSLSSVTYPVPGAHRSPSSSSSTRESSHSKLPPQSTFPSSRRRCGSSLAWTRKASRRSGPATRRSPSSVLPPSSCRPLVELTHLY